MPKGMQGFQKGNIPIKGFKKENTPWNKGIPRTQAVKDAVSKANKGRKAWNEGICHSDKTKEKIKIARAKQVISYETRLKVSGENSHFWKGGITGLTILVRQLGEFFNWRKQVFVRDNFTCQECHKRGYRLEAHHIKRFSFMFQEFLKKYSQFSPIDDKETLVRLAITYEPFWEISNGQTLCGKCHKKTKNYGKKHSIA